MRAHLNGRSDGLVTVEPLLDRIDGRFADLLATDPDSERLVTLRAAEGIGRPLGSLPSSTAWSA